ncbi:MAG TPA: haloalkane dehalogenase [Acidimicrobiia bacterium]|nr:haloalkane dehalogenase [Acidimicrobiia bacterium]
MPISPADPHPRATVDVLDTTMAFVDTGEGTPVVFLHGNPTSSYLWRNVIPHVATTNRCLAPDLVGMGESGPSAGGYRFVDHYAHLSAWFDAVVPDGSVYLVVHDWGSALGFHWANEHRDRVLGIAYMEALVRPVTWDEWPEQIHRIFRGLRSPSGEEMVLEKNVFVERVLPGSVLRDLTDEEMDRYRAPYLDPGEARRPTLTWPREIPIDGEPADVHAIVAAYAAWLESAEVPTLFVDADPGAILTGPQRDFCLGWPNQTTVRVRGSHFVQEDSPDEVGEAISRFLGGS